MAARLGGKIADQATRQPIPETHAGAPGTSDHALLPRIGHTEGRRRGVLIADTTASPVSVGREISQR